MADEKQKKENEIKIFEDERDKLLDHDYDGIKELDNPMPKWWLYGFYFCIAFAFLYLMYYHVLGWGPNAQQEYQAEMAYAQKHYSQVKTEEQEHNGEAKDDPFEHMKPLTDKASIAAGKKIFDSVCFACHGQHAQGMVGPNLTDDYWIHGCKFGTIMKNITTGFPSKGMPPYGGGKTLDTKELQDVVSYIRSLHDSHPANPKPVDMSRAKKCVPGHDD